MQDTLIPFSLSTALLLAWGMVDIHDYHTAAHSEQLKHWFSTGETHLCVDIERFLTKSKRLNNLLFADRWGALPMSFLAITTKASIVAWRELCFATSTPEHSERLHSLNPDLPVQDLAHYSIHWVDELMLNGKPTDPDSLLSPSEETLFHTYMHQALLILIATSPSIFPS